MEIDLALEDKDKDGAYVDTTNPESVPVTIRDPDDNNPAVKASTTSGSTYASDTTPTVYVSSKGETFAEINAEFKSMFGEEVPKELAQAYHQQLVALQGSRVNNKKPGAKVNVAVEGVSSQERKDLLDKIVKAYAEKKVAAASTGDPVALASIQKGNFGVTYTTLKKAYADNGIPFNAKSLGDMTVESAINKDAFNSNLNLINLQAKTYFPALADKIDKGYTVKQLLSPYLQTRANILEEDPDSIDLKDLQSVAKDSKNLMGLYEYEVSLRKDPKWRFTKNAQDNLSNVARTLAQTFGLMG